jgi:purine catabolism regulator
MVGDISGAGFVERALRIGKDLRNCRLVIAIVGSRDASPGDLEREVDTRFSKNHLSAVSADIGDAVLSVIALRGDRSLGLVVKALSDEGRTIGFSKISEADALPGAVEQARAAFSARQPCQFFDQLGLLRLLVPLADGSELAAFVEDELGSLLTHDAARDSTLIATLEAILDCDGNKSAAAKLLFVHRRTLYYRIERIEQILGLSLDSSETRLRLNVAVHAWKLLRGQSNLVAPAEG